MLKLVFKFEDCLPRPPGPIERFARGVVGVTRASPTSIPRFSFGRAESMASGLVDVEAGLWSPPMPGTDQRLMAVEQAGKPLLQFVYDDQGRLIETHFPGPHVERYAHDSTGSVRAVQWDGETSTSFTYHKHGELASTRYPDGSMFYYQFGSNGLCNSWRYPDGGECFVERDANGRLEALSCGTTTLHYVWAGGVQPRTIATATSDGVSRLDVDHNQMSIPFEEQSPSRRNHRTLRSPIGVWTLDDQGTPIEIISPFSSRVCLMNDPQCRTTTRWSASGRTVWAFNSHGLLDGVTATDGTRTVFVPADDPGHIFALSSRGIDVFRYIGGRLAMTRSMNGSFTRLTYASESGPLTALDSPQVTQQFQCDAERRLTGLSSLDLFRARSLNALTGLGAIDLRLKYRDTAHEVLDLVTSWLWDWPGFPQRNRLDQDA